MTGTRARNTNCLAMFDGPRWHTLGTHLHPSWRFAFILSKKNEKTTLDLYLIEKFEKL